MIRSMISYSTLPISFWRYALNTTIHLLNLVPSKYLPKTPMELWSRRKPRMRYLHVLGCPAHVLKGKLDKLEPKSKVCLLIGYPKETRGYLFYSHNDNKVFVSTKAKFWENDYMNNFTPKSRVVLAEMNELVIEQSMDETRDDVVVLDTQQDVTHEMTSTQETRRSGRIVRLPIRFIGLGETYEAISKDAKKDPYPYEQAMNDIDAHHWVKAMKSELDSMYSNQVWDLVKAPNSIKPVGCKWVYKRKRMIDGKVETFKVRLVAKGYIQKEGIDYEETFSPVEMLKFIRILLSIAAHHDYEI